MTPAGEKKKKAAAPRRRKKQTAPDSRVAKMTKAAESFDVAKVRADQVARSGGAEEE